jgi:hypothetical protein
MTPERSDSMLFVRMLGFVTLLVELVAAAAPADGARIKPPDRVYGRSKPVTLANLRETAGWSNDAGMPIVELLSALGPRLRGGDLFCFWIRYEAPTADWESNGAPWLCHPPTMSTLSGRPDRIACQYH